MNLYLLIVNLLKYKVHFNDNDGAHYQDSKIQNDFSLY